MEPRISKPLKKILRPLIRKAMRQMDPINGVTLTDILHFAKAKVDIDVDRLRSGIKQTLAFGLKNNQFMKLGPHRYGLPTDATDDLMELCGTCGGKKMRKRRRSSCPKKRRKMCGSKRVRRSEKCMERCVKKCLKRRKRCAKDDATHNPVQSTSGQGDAVVSRTGEPASS